MTKCDGYTKVAEIISRHERLEDALSEARVLFPRVNFWRSTPENDLEIENCPEEDCGLFTFDFVKHGGTYVRIDFDSVPKPTIQQME